MSTLQTSSCPFCLSFLQNHPRLKPGSFRMLTVPIDNMWHYKPTLLGVEEQQMFDFLLDENMYPKGTENEATDPPKMSYCPLYLSLLQNYPYLEAGLRRMFTVPLENVGHQERIVLSAEEVKMFEVLVDESLFADKRKEEAPTEGEATNEDEMHILSLMRIHE